MRGWAVLAAAALGCAERPPCGEVGAPTVAPGPGGGGNVLVIVLDDVGVDPLGSYAAADPVPTPTIDCLCARGVRFETTWALPLCSPGRAALQTGRLADRTGIGANVAGERELPLEEVTLGELGWEAGLATGLVGKWHLAGWNSPSAEHAPHRQGFDFWRGTPANLATSAMPREEDYRGYWQVVDGEVRWTTRYAVSQVVDDALAFVDAREEGEPWLLVVALHGAHGPYEPPPDHLIEGRIGRGASERALYRAILEATDTEIGRLLAGIDPQVLADTTVILTADNGTNAAGVAPPLDPARAKGTIYEGGLRVPLVVTGPHVGAPGGTSAALVHVADVLPTVAEILGVAPPAPIDGRSFLAQLADPDLPGADTISVTWTPEGLPESAVRDGRHKLVRERHGRTRFHDLLRDPLEEEDLLQGALDPEAEAALARLSDAFAVRFGPSLGG